MFFLKILDCDNTWLSKPNLPIISISSGIKLVKLIQKGHSTTNYGNKLSNWLTKGGGKWEGSKFKNWLINLIQKMISWKDKHLLRSKSKLLKCTCVPRIKDQRNKLMILWAFVSLRKSLVKRKMIRMKRKDWVLGQNIRSSFKKNLK